VKFDQPTFVSWLIDNSNVYSNSRFYPDVKHSIDHFRRVWFFNPLNAGSMRLTKTGYQFCTLTAQFQQYRHEIPTKMMPKTLLQMEKNFPCPYYLPTLSDLRLFDERTSLTLTLYANDLQKYLDNNDQLDK
jgi:hypothetical protein